jgi:transposase
MTALLLQLDLSKLVFLDESGCRVGMRRERGWAPSGKRVVGQRPGRHCKNISMLGAIGLGRRPLLMTHKGGVGTEVFVNFVRRRLTRWLREGDIVLMDNLRAHKRPEVVDAILAVGAVPLFLPPYSPDMNPIEFWWADIKRQLRKLAIDSEPELLTAIARLRKRLTHAKIASWYRHVEALLK